LGLVEGEVGQATPASSHAELTALHLLTLPPPFVPHQAQPAISSSAQPPGHPTPEESLQADRQAWIHRLSPQRKGAPAKAGG
jgi:hypothetical protein